ncbi:hypothetical protein PoB_006796700 [Plakobranchus ocellatus]|uniref:Uncharacterized protein n=1 Tax=Plakobranchus ocellatus TaxID=259542 RepID=A0AAV4DB33_9GAST|nr:hypothetical protein PoB_006796700 [Plakobranchus ocellatus]
MQKDKEVGRKEGGGWGTLTEPDRSRWTRIVTNRSRGTNLYVRRANATCPRTTIMHKDKEVGRKEGGGWGRLTEPDRSRWTRIVTNRSRGTNLYVRRANGENTHTDKSGEEKGWTA